MANSNNDKTLKELKKEFDEKIAKAKYANSIKAECYFYETSTAEYDSRSNNSLLSLSKNKPPIECTILTNGLSSADYTFITGIKNIYPKLIAETSKIKVKKKIYATTINETLGKILGKEVSIDDSNKEYVTSISYNEETEILKILKDFKKQLKSINTENIKTKITNNLKSPHTQVSVDQEGYFDSLGTITSSRGEYYQLCDKQQKEKYIGIFSGSTVTYPTIKEFLTYLQNYRTEFSVYNENKFINKELKYILDTLLAQINSKVQEAIGEIEKIEDKIEKICEEYKKQEKKEKKKYKSKLEKAIISNNEQKANKAIKKLRELGLSKKKIKSLIVSYAKAANVKVSYKSTKSLAIKTIKKKVVKKPAGSGGSGGSGGGSSETGAKNAPTKSKKKNTSKSTKNKNVGVVSIATIAAYEKTMKKKSETISNIKLGTTNKIEQAKLNLNAKISKINNDRDAKIANIEAKRDSDIANLYDDASDKINNIDITEADAKEQINTIKENLENDINSINNKANEEIEKIKISADEQIAQANKDSQAEIEDIQKSSDKEINNITENGVHEKTKTAENFENAAKETPAAEEADTSSLDEANSNKTESATTLENIKKDYNDNISAKEQEIVNQANNVENSTETVATEVEDAGTTEQTIVYEQESDTASNNDSGNSVNYSRYNSSDSNVATNSESSVDTAVSDVESEIVETPAVPDDTSEATLIPDNPNNEETSEISSSSSSEILDTPKKESKSSNIAIPIGLGVAATGAAAVAGVRFVKNRKQNEDVDETYDDENNDIDDYESGSDDSEYMKDDYLGPAGSMYTDTDLPEDNELSEIPDDTQYTDAGQLEEELEDDDFSEDEVLNDLG